VTQPLRMIDGHGFVDRARLRVPTVTMYRVVLACLFGLRAATSVAEFAAPVAVFELGEHCGDQHAPQAVSFPITAEEGRLHEGRFVVRGPSGATPAQLTDLEYWPGSRSIRSARAWIATGLRPSEVKRFEVHATEAAGAADAAPAEADVVVQESDGVVEIATEGCGFRFPVGRVAFDPPARSADVPGPVQAYRLADGVWSGGSEMYGEKRLVGYEAEIVSRGPIVGEMQCRYAYEDGTAMTLRVRLTSGAQQATWFMDVTPVDRAAVTRQVTESASQVDPLSPGQDVAANGWRLMLGVGSEALGIRVTPEFGENRWGKHEFVDGSWRDDPVHVKPHQEPAGLLVNLVPWKDWWDSSTTTTLMFLSARGAPLFSMTAEDAGAWVEPAAPGTWAPWANRRMRDKWLPVVKGNDGGVFVQISLASGSRRWRCGTPEVGPPQELDRVKDLVLAWQEKPHAHPRLYMDRRMLEAARRQRVDEARVRSLVAAAGAPQPEPHQSDGVALGVWLLTGDRRIAERVRLVQRLEHHLALNGTFDRMRGTYLLCGLYDGVLGSDLLTEKARRLARARLARLAYLLATPDTWSMERGYCSGNLNMSIAHVLNQGMIGCTLGDHPQAAEWVKTGLAMLEQSLADTVGPDGEWPESPAHYAHVSVSALLPLAIAARNGGFADYVADPRMKKLMLFLAKHYTPPDPRPTEDGAVGVSVLPPVGRGGARGRNGLPGVMARAMASADAEYASAQQWVWARAGFPRNIPDSRLGGWEQVYLDESLPAKTPAWSLDLFRQSGAILRHAFGTRDEWWVYLMASTIDGYPSENGGLPLVFARGAPIIARFSGGYAEREELFINRVLPTRPRGDSEFRLAHFMHDGKPESLTASGMPQADYAEGLFTIGKPRFTSHEDSAHDRMQKIPEWPAGPPASDADMTWRRQILLAKDSNSPDGTLYIRDSVTGKQPSMWQMWMLSDGISSLDSDSRPGPRPANANNNPGDAPRVLEGDRFLATGQFGVDTEIFIAEPTATPRSTLRWGRSYDYTPIAGVREDMDLLHLQRPDDGAYFVALHPRRGNERPVSFKTLADGYVIRADHRSRIDYAFLADQQTDVTADDIRFNGRAMLVRREVDGSTIVMSERGGVQLPPIAGDTTAATPSELVASGPASFVIRPNRIVVTVPVGHRGTAVRVNVPGIWRLAGTDTVVTLKDDGPAGVRIHVGAGVTTTVLERQP